ncbi:MAG: hypothetical protein JXB47_10350 [Anaerolineae bacterium]|nr:hypothetical protein [Anaerolineae bacterium]
MELYALWRIVRRWWWLVLIPVVVSAAFAFIRYEAPPAAWTVGMRFTAVQPPAPDAMPPAADPYEDANYVPWLTSEYLVNALTHWVQTTSFAEAVRARLAAAYGVELAPGALNGAFASDNKRSVMGVYITWRDAGQIEPIAHAAVDVLQTEGGSYFPQTAAAPVSVVLLDTIGVGAVPPSIMDRIVKPLLPAALGLAAGLALAFLVAYLDPTLHTREELEALGFEVIGEIPRDRAKA